MAREKNTAAVVEALALPICEEVGVTLWDVLFVKEGSEWFLRIILDKAGGVGFADCEAVSRALDKKLDEVDPIDRAYYLEVSSPGLGRTLSKDWHFQQYLGQKVFVKTIREVDGNREFTGLLKQGGGEIAIEEESGQLRTFERKQLAVVKVADDIEF